MATDTKRGAVHECLNCGALEDITVWLEDQGLHVVTAADKAVLDAENALLEQAANAIDEACYPVWWDAYRDYIARREYLRDR